MCPFCLFSVVVDFFRSRRGASVGASVTDKIRQKCFRDVIAQGMSPRPPHLCFETDP
jgi:hypothetical protein